MLEQVGYKEGLEEGKAKTLQQGFDEGEHRKPASHPEEAFARLHDTFKCCLCTASIYRENQSASLVATPG